MAPFHITHVIMVEALAYPEDGLGKNYDIHLSLKASLSHHVDYLDLCITW